MSDKKEIIVDGNRTYSLSKDKTLFMLLMEQKELMATCGSQGICGKCQVRFLKNAPLPGIADRTMLSASELRDGIRLACKVDLWKMYGDVVEIEIVNPVTPEMKIISDYQLNLKKIIEEKDRRQDYKEGWFAAIDLGTTTIAMQIIDNKSGEILDEIRALNPERIYGADVVSRIQASVSGRREEIRDVIQGEIIQGLEEMEQRNAIRVSRVILAANTTMVQLFLGHDVISMSRFPFQPEQMNEQDICLSHYHFSIIPSASAFVGGDIIAGTYALGLTNTDQYQMLIDLGTNGEIVLGNKHQLFGTATAAGPAFENSKTLNLPGSDIIRLIAKMLDERKVDATGLLADAYFDVGYHVDSVCISQEDIREIQKAKAAIHEGVVTLMEQAGIREDSIAKIYLAGGFGYGLDPYSAARIGLIPKSLVGKLVTASNTSLAGAVVVGLQETYKSAVFTELNQIATNMKVVNLAQMREFQEHFISEINFPE